MLLQISFPLKIGNICKNEVRLYSLSYSFDADYNRWIKDWNEACQPLLTSMTSTITTPADITLSKTYDGQSCQTLYLSCKKLDMTFSTCSSAYTRDANRSSCLCASVVLTLASECEIDGAPEC